MKHDVFDFIPNKHVNVFFNYISINGKYVPDVLTKIIAVCSTCKDAVRVVYYDEKDDGTFFCTLKKEMSNA